MNSEDTRRAEAILDSFEFKRLEKIKTKEPLNNNEVKIVQPWEGD